jgi:ubiquinone/menaquinone biosynthesis C-methylase UbiE
MKIKQKYSEQLVQRVNELYHDQINEDYDDSHPEILKQEESRWKENFSSVSKIDKPIEILDFGTGTGFIPVTIGEYLDENVKFTCADISQNMLNEARQNISSKNIKGQFEFKKIEPSIPFNLPFENNSFDVVMMNSVLHHIKETEHFLSEISRICRPGGKIIIAHEPNQRYMQNDFLSAKYHFFHFFIRPNWEIAAFLKKTGLLKIMQQLVYILVPSVKNKIKNKEGITEKINEVILAEKLHPSKLSKEEITMITDISAFEGFNPYALHKNLSPVIVDTYNHLFRVSIIKAGNKNWKNYEKVVKEKFPKDGATFFGVYKNSK